MGNLKDKRLFLLDMDGTLYLGDRLLDGAADFLDWVGRTGGRYIFLTNNSSKGTDDYVKKMKGLGVPARPQDFLTSVHVTVRYLLCHYAKKKLYVLGTQSLKQELSSAGLCVTERLEEGIDCLLMGFDTELTFSKLEDACRLLIGGADYIATHPDIACPTEYGSVPDCGSVAQMLFNATKRLPKYLGKPEPDIAELAVQMSGFDKDRTILIGDRLHTDIACGLNAGVDTALVLSGETRREDLETTEHIPTWVFEDIRQILENLKN